MRLEILADSYDKAIEDATKFRESFPQPAEAELLFGEIALAQRKLEQAHGFFAQARAAEPDFFDAALKLYETAFTPGQPEDALQTLEAWIESHPDNRAAKRALAMGYVTAGRLDDARVLHEKLLDGRPKDPVLLANLARIYQLQKLPQAHTLAKKALELSSE